MCLRFAYEILLSFLRFYIHQAGHIGVKGYQIGSLFPVILVKAGAESIVVDIPRTLLFALDKTQRIFQRILRIFGDGQPR